MGKPDLMPMGEFFDHVSEDYEEVHPSHIDRGDEYYVALSGPIAVSKHPIKVLDIGCGSGLELEALFRKVPNAQVHCIDLSRKLMGKLLRKYAGREIRAHLGSYLTYEYSRRGYRYIMASATLHHLVDDEKRKLYPKLRDALTEDGCLIVGDYFVSPDEARDRLKEYNKLISDGVDLSNGKYHFDVPTTADHEKALLREAGFASVKTVWESSNYSIITAKLIR